MEFKTVYFSSQDVEFKSELNNMELIGIETVASELLNFDKDKYSYHDGTYSYHADENEKINGLNINGFKMTKEDLYLLLEDNEENETLLRLEFN